MRITKLLVLVAALVLVLNFINCSLLEKEEEADEEIDAAKDRVGVLQERAMEVDKCAEFIAYWFGGPDPGASDTAYRVYYADLLERVKKLGDPEFSVMVGEMLEKIKGVAAVSDSQDEINRIAKTHIAPMNSYLVTKLRVLLQPVSEPFEFSDKDNDELKTANERIRNLDAGIAQAAKYGEFMEYWLGHPDVDNGLEPLGDYYRDVEGKLKLVDDEEFEKHEMGGDDVSMLTAEAAYEPEQEIITAIQIFGKSITVELASRIMKSVNPQY